MSKTTIEKYKKIQNELKKYICLEGMDISLINMVAGIDTAYAYDGDQEYGICAVEVFDYRTLEHIEHEALAMEITEKYIPGYFAFRELPICLRTIEKLKEKVSLFMVDGNGYLHPNHMGLATMLSIKTGVPSIGVAKSYYRIDGATMDNVAEELFATAAISVNQECYGYALRSRLGCNPIYVSPGNLIGFEDSLEVVKHCMGKESRIPILTRQADIATHIERKEFIKKLSLSRGEQ